LKSSLHSQIKKNDQQLKSSTLNVTRSFQKGILFTPLLSDTIRKNGIKSGGGWLASNIIETIDAKDSNKKRNANTADTLLVQ
jgi:hypothetical protein